MDNLSGIAIRVLTATNGSSFDHDENDIIIVGRTDDGAAKALRERLTNIWNAKKPEDREFWHDDFDKYYESWNINTTGTRLEP